MYLNVIGTVLRRHGKDGKFSLPACRRDVHHRRGTREVWREDADHHGGREGREERVVQLSGIEQGCLYCYASRQRYYQLAFARAVQFDQHHALPGTQQE